MTHSTKQRLLDAGLAMLLERSYNDGSRYVLHYVTAREAYNIIKAAEAGKSGDPGAWRDFVLPPPPLRVAVARSRMI